MQATSVDLLMNNQYSFVPGNLVGDTEDRCYIPIFANTLDEDKDLSTWYLGNIFMKRYYSVFDMSPWSEDGEDYLHVGIGLQAAADFDPAIIQKDETNKSNT